jgi:Beta/Gamma crystallin.
MNVTLKALLVAAGLVFAGQAAADIRLYQDDGFAGREWTADHPIDDFANSGFNDKASSAEVRGGPWQVCTDANFQGRCVVLRPGNYPSLGALGLNDRISSVRPVDRYGRGEAREYYGERERYSDRPYEGERDRYSERHYDDGYYERPWDRFDPYRGQ